MGIPLQQASATLRALNAPIVVLDACSVLDTLRAPLTDYTNVVPGLNALTKAAEGGPPSVTLVVFDRVMDEIHHHQPGVLRHLEDEVRRLEKGWSRFVAVANGILPGGFALQTNLVDMKLEHGLQSAMTRLLAATVAVEEEDVDVLAAERRLRRVIPPATRGKGPVDCIMVEAALRLASDLRGGGFIGRIFLCSSNTNDFCDRNRNLYASLDAELKSAGIEYTRSVNETAAILRL